MDNDFIPKSGDNITVKYHGELMENLFSESLIKKSEGLQAIKYHEDKCALIMLDTNDQLQMLVEVDNSPSGWMKADISPKNLKVTAFDIHHDASNNHFRIAYSREQDGKNQLLVSKELNLSQIAPDQFAKSLNWDTVVLNSKKTIDHVSMRQNGMLYSTSFKNKDATYAYLEYGKSPIEYVFPENTPNVIQLEVGQLYGALGVFVLYRMKYSNTMIFRSFPDSGGDAFTYRFEPTEIMNAFFTTQDSKGISQLYISGDGIFKFIDPANGSSEIICKGGKGIEFHKINVAVENDETTIWTIGEQNSSKGLYYMRIKS